MAYFLLLDSVYLMQTSGLAHIYRVHTRASPLPNLGSPRPPTVPLLHSPGGQAQLHKQRAADKLGRAECQLAVVKLGEGNAASLLPIGWVPSWWTGCSHPGQSPGSRSARCCTRTPWWAGSWGPALGCCLTWQKCSQVCCL